MYNVEDNTNDFDRRNEPDKCGLSKDIVTKQTCLTY